MLCQQLDADAPFADIGQYVEYLLIVGQDAGYEVKGVRKRSANARLPTSFIVLTNSYANVTLSSVFTSLPSLKSQPRPSRVSSSEIFAAFAISFTERAFSAAASA